MGKRKEVSWMEEEDKSDEWVPHVDAKEDGKYDGNDMVLIL